MLEQILEYLKSKMPEEACGVIIDNNTFIPVENVSDDPKSTFVLDHKKWTEIMLSSSNVTGIVHSHVDLEGGLSDIDKKASRILGIPYMLVELPSGRIEWTKE